MESGRIYATHHIRVLLRAAEEHGTTAIISKWTVPLLLNQLTDKCRAVVITAADILDEATDDPVKLNIHFFYYAIIHILYIMLFKKNLNRPQLKS